LPARIAAIRRNGADAFLNDESLPQRPVHDAYKVPCTAAPDEELVSFLHKRTLLDRGDIVELFRSIQYMPRLWQTTWLLRPLARMTAAANATVADGGDASDDDDGRTRRYHPRPAIGCTGSMIIAIRNPPRKQRNLP